MALANLLVVVDSGPQWVCLHFADKLPDSWVVDDTVCAKTRLKAVFAACHNVESIRAVFREQLCEAFRHMHAECKELDVDPTTHMCLIEKGMEFITCCDCECKESSTTLPARGYAIRTTGEDTRLECFMQFGGGQPTVCSEFVVELVCVKSPSLFQEHGFVWIADPSSVAFEFIAGLGHEGREHIKRMAR